MNKYFLKKFKITVIFRSHLVLRLWGILWILRNFILMPSVLINILIEDNPADHKDILKWSMMNWYALEVFNVSKKLYILAESRRQIVIWNLNVNILHFIVVGKTVIFCYWMKAKKHVYIHTRLAFYISELENKNKY